MILQSSNAMPEPPPWATPLGESYVLAVSDQAPELSNVEISFSYRQRDVPAGEEAGITVYYQAPGADGWQALPTTLNQYYNLASTQLQGPGRYAVMSNINVPISGPGWSMFAYPIAGERPVGAALAGIAGKYSAVYDYDSQDSADPWKLYAPEVPAWVNDLTHLAYGRGYWIEVSEALILPLRGADPAQTRSAATPSVPPMTLYGVASVDLLDRPPVAGAPVTALVDGAVCGQTTTQTAGEQIVFVLDVLPMNGQSICGRPGAAVTLMIDGQNVGQIDWISGPQNFNDGYAPIDPDPPVDPDPSVATHRIWLPLIRSR